MQWSMGNTVNNIALTLQGDRPKLKLLWSFHNDHQWSPLYTSIKSQFCATETNINMILYYIIINIIF